MALQDHTQLSRDWRDGTEPLIGLFSCFSLLGAREHLLQGCDI